MESKAVNRKSLTNNVITLLCIVPWFIAVEQTKAFYVLLSDDEETEKKDKEEIDQFSKHASLGNVPELKKMLKENPDLRFEIGSDGFTPLHRAAMAGKLESVKLLMVRMGDPESKQRKFQGTPLQYAAHLGHVDVVKYLLEAGANVNSKDTNHRTPLIWAVKGQRMEVIKELLANKADIQAVNLGGWTPLHYAAQSGNRGIFALLVENGADEGAVNKRGEKPKDVPVKKKK